MLLAIRPCNFKSINTNLEVPFSRLLHSHPIKVDRLIFFADKVELKMRQRIQLMSSRVIFQPINNGRQGPFSGRLLTGDNNTFFTRV